MFPRRAVRIALDVLIAIAAGAFDLTIYLGSDPSIGLRTGGFPRPVGVTVVVIGAAALLLRRRYPTAVFVICWAVGISAVVAPDMQPVATLLVALYTVAVVATRYVAVMAMVAALGAMAVMAVNTAPVGDVVGSAAWVPWILTTVVANVVLPGAVWSFARFRNRTAVREEQLRAEHRRGVERAARDERLRLSRELHDIVSHTVSVMTLQAAGARALIDQEPGRVGPALEVIERAGVQAMNELQRLLGVLRAEGADRPATSERQQLAELSELIELARSSGQPVDWSVSGVPGELDPSVELACYRVIQEALTNARKHAGPSAPVSVTMEWVPPELIIRVRNEAGEPAGPTLSTGNGLAGLAERVQLIGGRLSTDLSSEGGFVVTAVLPVTAIRQQGPPSVGSIAER